MKERLLQIRNSFNLNQEEFGERIGLSKASISALEGGSRNLTDRHIMLLRSELNINEEWIRNGQGEMFVQSDVFSLDEKARQHNLSELEIDIMKGYMELPPESRNDLINMFGKIYGKHNEIAATTEINIDEEVESYRRELEAEKKVKRSSAFDGQKGKSS